jgi:hypothetical protein
MLVFWIARNLRHGHAPLAYSSLPLPKAHALAQNSPMTFQRLMRFPQRLHVAADRRQPGLVSPLSALSRSRQG